jgi:hypothetical protein
MASKKTGKGAGKSPASGGAGTRPSDRGPRKLIEFYPETLQALELLARDSMKDVQDLADEAFRDLLKKHGRPTSLKEALRQSTRQIPANDRAPRTKKAR